MQTSIIVQRIAVIFGVTQAAIVSPKRESPLVGKARQMAFHVHHERNKCTMRETAKAFCRGAPTVTHGIKAAKKVLKNSRKMRKAIASI